MTACRGVPSGVAHGIDPQGQGGHGGGAQIAFGGQQNPMFALPVSHIGAEPWLTACLNACSNGRLQITLYACAIAASALNPVSATPRLSTARISPATSEAPRVGKSHKAGVGPIRTRVKGSETCNTATAPRRLAAVTVSPMRARSGASDP